MKIGILTQPLHHNYGGLLQNYALQQVLIRQGHQVETIWYENPKVSRVRVYLSRCKRRMLHLLFPNRFPSLKPQKYIPSLTEISIIRKNTDAFIRKNITRSEHPILISNLSHYADEKAFDVYVVGSDQCWRPKYNSGSILPTMFLDFAKNQTDVKRIAYAASFGADKWELTPEQTAICAPLVKMFDCITVREGSGVELCKKYLEVDAMHVLDPTMLLTKEDYIALVEHENEPKSKGSLFTYILDPNPSKEAFIHRMATMKTLVPFSVMPKYQEEVRTKYDIRNNLEDCVYPRVTSWLRAYIDAEMTIVDSFHGMVFSIIFNKPFWVIGNKSRGYSRFSSLLKIFDLQDRLIDEEKLDEFCYDSLQTKFILNTIDWQKVNAKLLLERGKCINLIKDNLYV